MLTNTKIAKTLAIAAGALLLPAAAQAETRAFERDGVNYSYVETAENGRTVPLTITQEFQRFTGTAGEDWRIEQGRLDGNAIRFIANTGRGRRVYEGIVDGDRITGTGTNANWSAVRAQ